MGSTYVTVQGILMLVTEKKNHTAAGVLWLNKSSNNLACVREKKLNKCYK